MATKTLESISVSAVSYNALLKSTYCATYILNYFLRFSRVATSIRLLVALKGTSWPSSLHFIESNVTIYKNASQARPLANPCNSFGETEEVFNIPPW